MSTFQKLLSDLEPGRLIYPAAALAALWLWESVSPYFQNRHDRVHHGAANLTVAVINGAVLYGTLGFLTVGVSQTVVRHQFGLLLSAELPWPAQAIIAFLTLDAWTYLWHVLNHRVRFLWRFHRMHHSDSKMDVTTASRFHMGELALSALLRIPLIAALGLRPQDLLFYDVALTLVTQLHHANIGLGWWDRWLSILIVTPGMHRIHHSRMRSETNSNYASILPVWDRCAGTFRTSDQPHRIRLGLEEFDDPQWQSVLGMLKTPFADPTVVQPPAVDGAFEDELD